VKLSPFGVRQFVPLLALTIVYTLADSLLEWITLRPHLWFHSVLFVGAEILVLLARSFQEAALFGWMYLPKNERRGKSILACGFSRGLGPIMLINLAIDLAAMFLVSTFVLEILKPNAAIDELRFLVMFGFVVNAAVYSRLGMAPPIIIARRLSLVPALKQAWKLSAGDRGWIILILYLVLWKGAGLVAHFLQQPGLAHLHTPWAVRFALHSANVQVSALFLILLGVAYTKFHVIDYFLGFNAAHPTAMQDG
jgi:hypothetical protein